MSNIWFGSDWHLGHVKICKYRTEHESEEAHAKSIIADASKVIGKRDTLFLLGDIAFTEEGRRRLGDINCRMFLVRGNHDCLESEVYLRTFDQIYGILKYKEFWLSHAPIHPNELRGRINLHGHVHRDTIVDHDGEEDMRYFNCCPEHLYPLVGRPLVSLDEIRECFRIKI